MRNAYEILVGKPDGKISLIKPGSRWEGNIRTDLGETVWESTGWFHPTHYMDHWRTLVKDLRFP